MRHVLKPMTLSQFLLFPRWAVALAYLATYVLVDWISFIHPLGPFGVTPWSPPTGLSFALILLFGQRFLPLLFVAPLLADIAIRQLPLPLAVEVTEALVIGAGYGTALLILLQPRLRFDPSLASTRDLALLIGLAIVSAAVVSCVNVGILSTADVIARDDIGAAIARYWVGDVIGIAVISPFLLVLLTHDRLPRVSWEMVAQAASVLVAMWLVFAFTGSYRFQLFYVLFLPVVWIAVRFGIEGASAGIVLIQLALIAAIQISREPQIDVTVFQAMMLILTLTGLAVGILVTERRRAEFRLRMHQDALSRVAHLGSMGEMAATLAHEINQPLTAAGNYARHVVETLTSPAAEIPAAIDAARKSASQVQRAADVVRRLRDLIRLDKLETAPILVERLVEEAIELFHPDPGPVNIVTRTRISRDLPPVMADVLQIEQVLLNLMRNAVEAIREAGDSRGTISIEATSGEPGFVEVRVRDSGRGFRSEIAVGEPLPFFSTKEDGLGLGLSLSRSVVEKHGGRMWFGGGPGGAVVHFTLPVAHGAASG